MLELVMLTKGLIWYTSKLKLKSSSLFISDAEQWDKNNTLVGRAQGIL